MAYHCFFYLVLKVSSTKYLAKPLSTFHQINAYEEGGFLILDMCAADDGKAIANYNIQNLRKSGEALDEVRLKLWEYTFFLIHDIFSWVQLMFCHVKLQLITSLQRLIKVTAPKLSYLLRCTIPCAGSSLADLFCRSTSATTRPTTRTWTTDQTVQLVLSGSPKTK